MLRAFLFDLDMTLVDSSALESWRRIQLWSHVMANLGLVRPFAIGACPAHELPARLRTLGFKVGIVTSSPRNYAEAVIKMFRIEHDALVAYHDTEEHKPDPAPIQLGLKLLGVSPEEAVHAGDGPLDSEASYHAGVWSIGAGWGVQNTDALSSAAPDTTFMKPSTLLKVDSLRQRGYFAELFSSGVEPIPHAGSFIRCGDGRYALGRYFQGGDVRHASGQLSMNLLAFKNEDSPAPQFAKSLVAFVRRLDWTPDYVVSVPPKPGQARNRFASIFDAAEDALGDDVQVARNGLECVKDVSGYKNMGSFERASAIRGAFTTRYDWSKNRILLFDDVLTSGETTKECARVLTASGAAEVQVVALGRAQQAFSRKLCGACGSSMTVRTQRATGEKFWGCLQYPNCRNTVNV